MAGDARAALLYSADWRFGSSGQAYGAIFTAPSPLRHFWSLAIEEQFHVAFPLLAALALRAGRRWFAVALGLLFTASVAAQLAATDNDVA